MKKLLTIKKWFKDAMSKAKTIQLISAVVLLIIGSGLLIAAFIVAPTGEIDNSVLISFGEILTFVGAIFGVDYSYRYKKIASKEDDCEKNE